MTDDIVPETTESHRLELLSAAGHVGLAAAGIAAPAVPILGVLPALEVLWTQGAEANARTKAAAEIVASNYEEQRLRVLDMFAAAAVFTPVDNRGSLPQRIAEDPARMRLLNLAIQAAARAGSREKLILVGKLLANGGAADSLDNATRLLAIVDQMDELELLLVGPLAAPTARLHPQAVAKQMLPQLDDALIEHVLANLTRLGILHLITGGTGGGVWVATPLARLLDDLLVLIAAES